MGPSRARYFSMHSFRVGAATAICRGKCGAANRAARPHRPLRRSTRARLPRSSPSRPTSSAAAAPPHPPRRRSLRRLRSLPTPLTTTVRRPSPAATIRTLARRGAAAAAEHAPWSARSGARSGATTIGIAITGPGHSPQTLVSRSNASNFQRRVRFGFSRPLASPWSRRGARDRRRAAMVAAHNAWIAEPVKRGLSVPGTDCLLYTSPSPRD